MNEPEAPKRGSNLGPLRRLAWTIPLGWQLSLLYALLLLATLTVVGSVVYSKQEKFLVDDAAQRLIDQANRTAAIPAPPNGEQDGRGGPHGGFGSDDHTPPQYDLQDHLLGNLVQGLSGPDNTVAVLDTQGNVLTTTQGLSGAAQRVIAPVTAQQVSQVLNSSQSIQWTVKAKDGTRDVVVLSAVTQQPPSTGPEQKQQPVTLLVEQSASLAAADAALKSLGLYLLLGIVGGTFIGVVLVLAFTRAVLRPLDSVADTADAIASGDLQRRLNLPEGRNEVARLGKTFDYMVGRLVSTLEAQRRFIADASHELRTPLTSLKGLAEILVIGAHGNDTRVVEQSAQAINTELIRMIRLVTDLLTLSRLDNTGDAPTPGPRRVPMDLCTTVSAAVDQMVGLAESRGVRLSQQCAAPLTLAGDPGQIKQVLLNLADNALRYTPAGGEVSVKAVEEATMARIDVQDTGSGIDPNDLPHIFERFYRGDISRTRATGNSGLGLAIAQSIIEAHGGSIDVQSMPGTGTCFTIRLPLGSAKYTEATEKEPALSQG